MRNLAQHYTYYMSLIYLTYFGRYYFPFLKNSKENNFLLNIEQMKEGNHY